MQNGTNQSAQVRHAEVEPGESGQRIDNFLLRRAPGVPRSHVYRLIRTGQVRVNGGRVKPTRKLAVGDKVRIPPMHFKSTGEVSVPDGLARAVGEAIVHETEDFIVVNKPPGLAVHAGSGLAFGLIDALRQIRGESSLELVHRLDRGTSGCLLVAKDIGRVRSLQELFRTRDIKKTYLALVDGVWQLGAKTVDVPLEKNKSHAGERRVIVSADGQAAVSHFECVQTFANASLMQINIETGRTHQIRVHAKHCGHAVIGDTRYGDNARNALFKQQGLARLYLHSVSLEFEWQGESYHLEAPPDADWVTAQAVLTGS